eukprot:SAG31_NODE_6610_length_1953_cov_1.699569_1_plen_89_part_00
MSRPAADKVYLGTIGGTYGYGLGPRFGGETAAMVTLGYGPIKPRGSKPLTVSTIRDLSLAEAPIAYYGAELWLALEDHRIDELRVRCR